MLDELQNTSNNSRGAAVVSSGNVQMQALLTAMSRMESEMHGIRNDLRDIKSTLTVMNTKLHTLVGGHSNVPTLIVVVPKKCSNTVVGFVKGRFVEEVQIYFYCPISMEFGNLYVMQEPKVWVRKMAPVIQATLIVLKVAALACGVPIPLPTEVITQIGALAKSSIVQYLDNLMSYAVSEAESVANDDGLVKLYEQVSSAENIGALDCCLEHQLSLAAAEKTYDSIYSLLHDKLEKNNSSDPWRPANTGLVRVTSNRDGTTAWIKEKCVVQFHAEGAAAFRLNKH